MVLSSASTSADEDVIHNSYASIIVWKDGTTCIRISVPCRLVSPTLSKIDENDYILWVGSADDAELRCFHMVNQEIRSVKVDTLEAVTSPIMTIDCCDDDQHSVALGCQDGTVCIMSFACRRVDDRISPPISPDAQRHCRWTYNVPTSYQNSCFAGIDVWLCL
jgi:hypothetical protein